MSGDDEKIRALAEALIQEQSTITVATARERTAWAAPVYYVFVKSAFYFFSDPTSRHILESLESGQAAATVYAHATSWQGIRGLQMSGVIEPVSAGLEAVKVIRAYLAKFPFTREFFESGDSIDLTAFSKRFRVRLYRFRPSLIYYLDNSIKFGFREEVEI